MEETESKSVLQETPCNGCGAALKFAPGTNHLKCDYCGAMNEIKVAEGTITEHDFSSFLSKASSTGDLHEVHTVECNGCGANTTLKPNTVSDMCPYCGTTLVIENASRKAFIKPESVLPFKIDRKTAFEDFRTWIKKLWFAPNDLKLYADNPEKLKGLYIPYWTYDCNTYSDYSGEKGVDRQETEYYTETVNGRQETRTRTRTVTDWYPASGSVNCDFDDLLINASNSLPKDYADKLEPWDLENLAAFDEKYISGFIAETYQVGLEDGFNQAKDKMKPAIESKIRQDIGGDHQRINSVDTEYNNIKFRHTLLPIWLSAYRYKGKVFRFMINGRTGEVQGERPYSWVKISFAIAAALAVIGGLVYVFMG